MKKEIDLRLKKISNGWIITYTDFGGNKYEIYGLNKENILSAVNKTLLLLLEGEE